MPSLGCLSPVFSMPPTDLGGLSAPVCCWEEGVSARGAGGWGQRGPRDQLARGSHFCSLPTGGVALDKCRSFSEPHCPVCDMGSPVPTSHELLCAVVAQGLAPPQRLRELVRTFSAFLHVPKSVCVVAPHLPGTSHAAPKLFKPQPGPQGTRHGDRELPAWSLKELGGHRSVLSWGPGLLLHPSS